MKKRTKVLIAAISLLTMLPLCIIPASANSRAQEWYGTDASGTIVIGDDVPIEVTSELLTFDIPTLPYASYRDAESFIAYDSRVTAEYTFYNPTDMTVTATLLFPFGKYPEYAKRTSAGNIISDVHLDKYGVTVNGQAVEAKIRHTLSTSYDGKFNTDAEIAKILNEYVTDDFYSPDLPVTKYSYTVHGISDELLEKEGLTGEGLRFIINYIGDTEGMAIYLGECHGYSSNNIYRISEEIEKNGQEIVIYTFGRPFYDGEATPALYDYYNRGRDFTKIDANIEIDQETMTFEEFALANYDEERGVSEIDWYNTVVADMKRGVYDYKYNVVEVDSYLTNYLRLDRWYEYEITLAPGESITNTVTAPLYPVIDAWDRPIKYDYTYYLSPASNWADFGSLEIVINTPYEMIDVSLEGFEKTDGGYRLVREGLPKSEDDVTDLFFTLENDGETPLNQPHPSIVVRFFEGVLDVIVSILLFVFAAITQIFTLIADLFRG